MTIKYQDEELVIRLNRYYNSENIAIQLYTTQGEPFVTLTVNICELPEHLACLDTNNFQDGIELMRKYQLGAFTGNFVTSGFCAYPVYYLNMDNIKKYMK